MVVQGEYRSVVRYMRIIKSNLTPSTYLPVYSNFKWPETLLIKLTGPLGKKNRAGSEFVKNKVMIAGLTARFPGRSLIRLLSGFFLYKRQKGIDIS